jgi:tetratricopeptide (TPR) repeat protein
MLTQSRFQPLHAVLAICLVVSSVSPLQARQNRAAGNQTTTAPVYSSEGGAILVVTVLDGAGARLKHQSVVKLVNQSNQNTNWQATTDQSETMFGDLAFGKYQLEVSAVGYLTAHKEFEVTSPIHTIPISITLQPDIAAIDLYAPIPPISPRASRETKHAIASLESGKLRDAEKHLQAAQSSAPESANVDFLLGYLSFQQNDFNRAQSYLSKSASLDPHNVRAFNLMGRLRLTQKDYAGARTVLEQAVAADPGSWMAHYLLADALLMLHDYEKALEQAEIALQKSNSSNAAQIVRGQAFASLGRDQEAAEALNSYLQKAPGSPVAPQVRDMVVQLEHRAVGASEKSGVTATAALLATVADPLLAAAEPSLPMPAWQPPGVDDVMPSVAAGVACPEHEVIEKSGEQVTQLVDDVSRFSAIEDLVHERLDEIGNPVSKDRRKFDYVVSISTGQSGSLLVDEYRSERYGVGDLPDEIVDKGFPGLALVFHPNLRDDFQMTCEGLGDWHGQAAWLVHFRQRDDRPKRMQDYMVGSKLYPVELKGRAWITADKFQIIRIESELVSPLPQIQLAAEHQIVDYGPVLFEKKNVELWLPKSVEIYMDFRHHRFYRRHTFDHYMLFSVDSSDKVRDAKDEPHGPTSVPIRRRQRKSKIPA